jgi:Tfp pilus assembly protein FimT
MKIFPPHLTRPGCQNGSAVLVFITLLAIMVILAAANGNALVNLHRETKLLEQRQVERLNDSQTNAITVVESPAKPESK